MSTLDHSQVVLNFDGEPLRENVGTLESPKIRDLTFHSLAITSLMMSAPNEHLGAEAKARSYLLTGKFYKGNLITLTVDEAAFLKDRAGKVLSSVLAYGRFCDWLEGVQQREVSDENEC